MRSKLAIYLLIALLYLSSGVNIHAASEDSFLDESPAASKVTNEDADEDEYFDPTLKDLLKDPVQLMETAPMRLKLEECIRIALDHNAKLEATGYSVDAAMAQLKEAEAGGWPILEYEYRTAPVPNDATNALRTFFKGEWSWWNRVKVALVAPVYTFGKLSLAKEMAKSGIKAAEIQAYQEKAALVTRIRQLYYGVLLAEEVGRLLKEAHNKLDEELNKRKVAEDGSEENGDTDVEYSPIENLKLKVFLFDLEKRLAETRNKQELALEGLRIQMGLAQGTVFTVFSEKLRPVDADVRSFEEYLSVAMANRPDIRLIETGLQVKRNQYLLEKRKLAPDVGIGAFVELGRTIGDVKNQQVTDDYNDPFNFNRAGIGLQIGGKLDFHGSSARIKKSQSEYYKLNLEQMIAKEGIKMDVKDAFLRARMAQANLGRAREAEKAARQILFLSRSNLEIGVGEQKDVVDALQMILLTRGRYFESVFDYNIALASLDEKIGLIPEVAK